jgi:hypothetical protein
MEGVDLYVIQDNTNYGFLMRTQNGVPVFGPLDYAKTYLSMTAVQNHVARFKGDFDFGARQK